MFGEAHAGVRSFFYPCSFVKEGILYAITDPVPRKQDPRGTEYLAVDRDPGEVVAALGSKPRGSYAMSVLHSFGTDLQPIRDAYHAMGFRLKRREPFMQISLDGAPRADSECPAKVERVTTPERMEQLAKAAGRRPLLPQHLEPGNDSIRAYVAVGPSDELMGWVRCSRVRDGAYCSSMFVRAEHRRQGIGRALLNRMLVEDQRLGVRESILLASMTGALVYPKLGYRQTATLMIFSPPRT